MFIQIIQVLFLYTVLYYLQINIVVSTRCGVEEIRKLLRDQGSSIPSTATTLLQGPRLPLLCSFQ